MKYFSACGWRTRTSLLLSTLLATAFGAQAQAITNGGFNAPASCVSANSNSPFSAGCVPNWLASHGTPQIKSTTNNTYAYMWSDGTGVAAGEGIFNTLSLQPNVRYEIRYYARTAAGSYAQFAVELAGNLTNNSNTTPPSPSPRLPLTIQALNASWAPYTVQFTSPTWSTTQLWMYPQITNTRYDVNVDSTVVTTCVSGDVFYQATISLPGQTRTQRGISAGTAVTSGPQGPVVVQPGQNVSFRSLNTIKLETGFSAEGDFEALVLPCNGYQGNSVAPPNPCACLGAVNYRVAGTSMNQPVASTGQLRQQASQADSTALLTTPHFSPSPTTGKMAFNISEEKLARSGTFLLYNATGTKVGEIPCHALPWQNGALLVDVSYLPDGMYLYQFVTGSYSLSGRFVVQK